MKKIDSFLLAALALGAATTFAAKDSTFHVQNSVRVGMDDNLYATDGNEKDTAYITDILNLSGKMVFSSRSDLLLYWQPEFRYRFDAGSKAIMYQDFYTKLNHAISERVFVSVSDRLHYAEQDGQADVAGRTDQNYFENDLMGALDFTVGSLSQIKVGAGYKFRDWSDNAYSVNNDFDQLEANGTYVREVRPNTTHVTAGINYVDHSYTGSRGGFDSVTVFGGTDHNFSSNLSGVAQLGYSFSSVDTGAGNNDSDSPFMYAGLDYSATERTKINTSIGYDLSFSENSLYNAQDQFKLSLGVSHDLTGKISVTSSLAYILSSYDSDYANAGATVGGDEGFLNFVIRGSYQVSRNNFVDMGYQFSARDSDVTSDYSRNRLDLGWRIRL